MNDFWTGFEKQAAIKPTGGFRWVKPIAAKVESKVIDYSKLKTPTQAPMWKQKLLDAGKTPATAPAKTKGFVRPPGG